MLDLAVNVRPGGPPPWLAERLANALGDLSAYPDDSAARHAIAARHGRAPDEVLVTHGAAEAFVLVARNLHPRRAVVVHPQFTEPEAALRDAGRAVDRVVLPPPFDLDPTLVPDDADLVLIGNPTNPTSRLHPRALLLELARPGRVLVVDEAFMDAVPGEPESLDGDADVPGLVVVRSLTKQFGLAGLRVGYLLAQPPVVEQLSAGRPLWPVSHLAVVAARACAGPRGAAESEAWARRLAGWRGHLVDELRSVLSDVPGAEVMTPAAAPFVLVRIPRADAVRTALRERGIAVRRGDTFPGLGPDWLRVAVRDRAATGELVTALRDLL